MRVGLGLSLADSLVKGGGVAPFPNTKSTDFDGVDDYIATATGSSIGIGNIFSMSCWVNADTLASYDAFCGSATSNSMVGGFGFIHVSGNWRFFVGNYNSQYIDSSASAATGSWVHLLGVYDNSLGSANMEFFINGVSQGTANRTTALIVSGIFEIGRIRQNAYNLNGKEDEVSLWDIDKRADASDLYNSGTPTNLAAESGLVFWSRMGDSAVFNANSQWEFPEQTKINNWSSHSFEFSVDDYLDIGLSKPAALNLPGDMSISAWIKLDSVAAGTEAIVGDVSSSATKAQWSIEVNRTAGKLTTLANGSYLALTSNTSLVADTWYHVVMTRSGSTGNWDYNIYLNGINDGSANTAYNPDAQQGCAIGRFGHYNGAYFNGKIDDVAIFDTALTSGNVTSIYASGVPNDVSDLGISGLQGYWRMGEGSSFAGGNWTIPDASTNSNDGTSANMNEADNVNTAPDNENQGLSVGMISGSVVEETP